MFLPTGNKRWSGSPWYYQILDYNDEGVVVQVYDEAYSEKKTISYNEYNYLVQKYGLWEKTGLYQFDRAENPANHDIRYCSQSPQLAGEELYYLRQELKKLKGE